MIGKIIFKISSFFIKDILGLTKAAFFAFAFLMILFRAFKMLIHAKKFLYPLLAIKSDLPARYGKDSWAVITGASDGIGKSFAFKLAEAGFNIVLLGRNREKLEGVEKELKSQYSSAKTWIVVEDNENASDSQFTQRITDQIKDLDVSLLVNNAGVLFEDKYTDIPIADVRKIVTVNALAPALITRAFLPILSQRKKSGLITVASIAADHPSPNSQIYGATKAFVDYVSRGLKDEHKNIDFLSLKPAYVATKMTGKEVSVTTVSPDECASAALRALGHTDSTYGSWRHSIQAAVFNTLPGFIRSKL